MSRKPRKESRTKIYHLVNRGLEKRPIFGENRERSRMINIIRKYYKEYQINFYAYCIMPNHFHLLVQGELEVLALFMAVISARYALYYNYKHQRSGYVFQDRYRSQCVEDESYFWNCVRYIHLNPLKAGLASDLVSYPYGSMKEYCTIYAEEDQILCAESYAKIKEEFETGKNFMEFHGKRCRDIFIDEKADEFEQKIEVAMMLLEDYAAQKEIPLQEALDYAELRKSYEQEMKTLLKISKGEAEKIQDVIKGRLQ